MYICLTKFREAPNLSWRKKCWGLKKTKGNYKEKTYYSNNPEKINGTKEKKSTQNGKYQKALISVSTCLPSWEIQKLHVTGMWFVQPIHKYLEVAFPLHLCIRAELGEFGNLTKFRNHACWIFQGYRIWQFSNIFDINLSIFSLLLNPAIYEMGNAPNILHILDVKNEKSLTPIQYYMASSFVLLDRHLIFHSIKILFKISLKAIIMRASSVAH